VASPKTDPFASLDGIPVETLLLYLARRTLATPSAAAPTAAASDELLTAAEVARLLKITTKAVYRMAKSLGVVRVGRRVRFARTRVLARLGR
jgi:excisionase family DNA binding protein